MQLIMTRDHSISFEDAVRIKFKIDSTKYPAFYKNILRRKLSDFLIEERRRESTRMAHHAKQQMNLTQIK